MKRVLHISDLHFGRIHPPAIQSLESFLKANEKNLDLIVMTGDWTQRARSSQYLEAAEFIKRLPVPLLTIPGNHDIPLYNFWVRLLRPLKNYNKYIRELAVDMYKSEDIVIVGFRTAHKYRTVEGRILQKDIDRAKEIFESAPAHAVRMIACHHPVFQSKALAKIRPRSLAQALIDLRPHIVVSGHSHLNWIELVRTSQQHEILHVSAGSATSNRLRGEVNSFHVFEVESGKVQVETYFLEEEGFIIKDKSASRSVEFKDLPLA